MIKQSEKNGVLSTLEVFEDRSKGRKKGKIQKENGPKKPKVKKVKVAGIKKKLAKK